MTEAAINYSQNVKPLKRATLAQEVMEQTRQAIFAGQYPPSRELSEPQLAEYFGVSRGPAREALAILEAKGLVEKQRNGRARVKVFTPLEVANIFEVRIALEVTALTAVIRIGGQVDDLQEHLANMHAAANERDFSALLDHDMQFHTTLVRMANNPALSRAYETVADQVRLIISRYEEESVEPNTIVDDHNEIISAIETGDAANASELMSRHIKGTVYHDADSLSSTV